MSVIMSLCHWHNDSAGIMNQATTQGVAGILLSDCAKSIDRNSEVSDDGFDRKRLRMLLHRKFEFWVLAGETDDGKLVAPIALK